MARSRQLIEKENALALCGKVLANFWDVLRSLYTQHGITPDKEIFPYCAIGGRSGYTWFVLKYLLGYPQRAQLRWLLE